MYPVISGLSGSSGTSGEGSPGSSGTSGTSGISGSSGTSGVTGSSGTSGIGGSSGTSGISGSSGTSGTSGSSGTSGISGSSGTSGISGSSGTSGSYSIDVEELNFNVYVSGETSIYLDDYSWYDYQVSGLTLRTPAGTVYISMVISGTSITGMDNITGTTTINMYYSTANNTVNTGKNLYILINNNIDAGYLIGSVKINRI